MDLVVLEVHLDGFDQLKSDEHRKKDAERAQQLGLAHEEAVGAAGKAGEHDGERHPHELDDCDGEHNKHQHHQNSGHDALAPLGH